MWVCEQKLAGRAARASSKQSQCGEVVDSRGQGLGGGEFSAEPTTALTVYDYYCHINALESPTTMLD